MIIRNLLVWLAIMATAAQVLGIESGSESSNRLNILLITADDLGVQLGCYGETLIETPNLDRLAASGVQFETAYVTQASCSSSRSSMFTGLHVFSTGQYGVTGGGFSLHPELRDKTIPNLLKPAGYYTGIIGKLHVAPEESFKFDYRVVTEESNVEFTEPPDDSINCRNVRLIADKADEFLHKKGDHPFFLMVNYDDPHALKTSEGNIFPVQVKGLPENPLPPGKDTLFAFQQVDSPEMRIRTAGYYNAVQRLDDGIGMLIDVLQEHERYKDTLIIFIGDHGAPFVRGKKTTYEAGLRIPFIVLWPGVSNSMKSHAMVSTVDILPTILDAADIDQSIKVHGKSLRSVCLDEGAPFRDYLVGEHHFHARRPFYPRRAIRDNRYKLIHNLLAGKSKPGKSVDSDPAYAISQRSEYDNTAVRRAFDTFADPPEFELYDLQDDAIEFKNLAGNPEYREIQKRLMNALIEYRKKTEDPFLDPDFLKQMAKPGQR